MFISNMALKTLKILLWIVPFTFVLLLLHTLYFLDLSLQPVPTRSEAQESFNVHLISYATGAEVYRQNQNILAMSALNRGVDFIYNYRRHNIDPAFMRSNPIMNEARGAGFWLWKPYLILETLKKIPEGDILIYADTGLLIRQDIRDYFTKALGDKDIVLFAYPPKGYGLVSTITSGDIFEAINCREACRYGHHVWAGILVLRNSEQSRRFMEEWLALCQKTDLLMKGRTHNIPSFPEYRHHQHDESLLSALAAKRAAVIHFTPMDSTFFKHIHIHRRKDNSRSLLGGFSIQYRSMVRRLFNAKITYRVQQYLAKILDKSKNIKVHPGYLNENR